MRFSNRLPRHPSRVSANEDVFGGNPPYRLLNKFEMIFVLRNFGDSCLEITETA
jgi:hypothetical protein